MINEIPLFWIIEEKEGERGKLIRGIPLKQKEIKNKLLFR